MIVMQILELYAIIGLGFMLVYIYDVGKLISKKYDCSLREGMWRFEKAGSTISNIKAVLYGMLLWPKLYVAMKRGVWDITLTKMVEECDYENDEASAE